MTTEDKKLMGEVVISYKSKVVDYNSPTIETVSARITDVRPGCEPTTAEDGITVDLKAGISSTLRLPHRSTVRISCGFSMDLPPGFRASISSTPAMAARGLLVVPTEMENGVVEVWTVNIGKEIVTVDPGQVFARMSLSPIYGVVFER